jgi:DNA-binding MarR family transcriptional regulator
MQSSGRHLIEGAQSIVADCAGWNTRLASRRITQFLERRMAPSGLSLAQLGLMAQVASAVDDRLAALAERAGLDQSTLSRNLRGLEEAGLVEIGAVDGDLRRRVAWLTEKGVRKLEAAMPVWRAAHAELAARLDPALARALGEASRALVET